MNIKKHLPNALTCANLFTSCIGIVYAFNGNISSSIYFIIISGIFDFFDGFVARLLNVKSSIGKELDSLADVISFGLLPSVIIYQMMLNTSNNHNIAYFGFLIAIFSAIRLAKFNIDSRQSEDFLGLNTPTNAFFIASLPYIPVQFNQLILIALIIILCFLLISNIKLFSLKFNNYSWKTNKYKYFFLIISVLSFSFIMFAAVPLILILYFIFSTLYFKNN